MSAEDRLRELGIGLAAPSPPIANYVPAVTVGGLVFLSGVLPVGVDGVIVQGKVGSDLSIDEGTEAARLATLGLLARLRVEIGSLDRVQHVVRLGGFVNCGPDFVEQPRVINGASDLLVAVFGEAGKHARAAVGVASLPLNAAVEVELIVALTP